MRISDWSSDVCASDLCSYQRDALYKIAPPRLNYRSRHQMDASPLRKLPQGLRRATSDSFATRRAMKTSLMARGRISAPPLALRPFGSRHCPPTPSPPPAPPPSPLISPCPAPSEIGRAHV